MRALALFLATLLLTACGQAARTTSEPVGQTAGVMAAALQHLVANDHTFGEGPPPFTDYLVQERVEVEAASGQGGRPLTDEERQAIAEALQPFGGVQFIADPADFRTPDLQPTVENAAILGVGEPTFEGETALVPVSLWCGGVCGTWITYRLALVDEVWTVTGTEGPIAIS